MATFNKEEAQAFLDLLSTLKSRSQVGDKCISILDRMCEDAEMSLSVKERKFGSASDTIKLEDKLPTQELCACCTYQMHCCIAGSILR